jgi:hypothetical protein
VLLEFYWQASEHLVDRRLIDSFIYVCLERAYSIFLPWEFIRLLKKAVFQATSVELIFP